MRRTPRAARRRPLDVGGFALLAWLAAAVLAGAAWAQAPAAESVTDARAALDAARASEGPASPDAPAWREALDAARAAVAATDGGPGHADALAVLARAYQGARWWSRAHAAWGELEAVRGALADDERQAWRDAALQLAYARYRAGDLRGAEVRIQEVLGALPEDAEALRWAGRIALERGRPEAAIPSWRRLVELRPTDEGARFFLALAEERAAYGREASDAFRAGLEAYDAGDAAAATDAFARAVQAAPDWNEALRWRARTAGEAGLADAAVTAWSELARRLPDDEDVAWFLSRARLSAEVGREAVLAADAARAATERGDAQAALAAWRRAAEAAPGWPEARVGVARAALAAGDAETATAAWSALLDERAPGDPLRDEARRSLAAAELQARLGPRAAVAYGAALAAYERGDAGVAARELETVVEAAPDVPEPWALLGRIAFARADWATAARAYARASELNPNDDDLAFFAEEARRLAGPDTAP